MHVAYRMRVIFNLSSRRQYCDWSGRNDLMPKFNDTNIAKFHRRLYHRRPVFKTQFNSIHKDDTYAMITIKSRTVD